METDNFTISCAVFKTLQEKTMLKTKGGNFLVIVVVIIVVVVAVDHTGDDDLRAQEDEAHEVQGVEAASDIIVVRYQDC